MPTYATATALQIRLPASVHEGVALPLVINFLTWLPTPFAVEFCSSAISVNPPPSVIVSGFAPTPLNTHTAATYASNPEGVIAEVAGVDDATPPLLLDALLSIVGAEPPLSESSE